MVRLVPTKHGILRVMSAIIHQYWSITPSQQTPKCPGWKTPQADHVSPDTDWVLMCGSNAGSLLKLVNGVAVAMQAR